MYSNTNVITVCLLTACMVTGFCDGVSGAKKTPPADPAPVEYRLDWIGSLGGGTSKVFAMNDVPVAVGRATNDLGQYRAFRWSTADGIQDLNCLSNVWIDLNTNDMVEGYVATDAYDINAAGKIVGTAVRCDPPEKPRGFLFDEAIGFLLLPTIDASTHRATNINDNDEVLGDWSYDICFLWSPADQSNIQLVEVGQPSSINNRHFLLGNADTGAQFYSFSFSVDGILQYQLEDVVPGTWDASFSLNLNSHSQFGFTGVKHRGLLQFISVGLYTPDFGPETIVAGRDVRSHGINDSADIGYNNNYRGSKPCLYRQLERKSYKIYDLLNADAKNELSAIEITYTGSVLVNDSNVAGVPEADPFDHLCGEIRVAGMPSNFGLTQAFVLTPVATDQ